MSKIRCKVCGTKMKKSMWMCRKCKGTGVVNRLFSKEKKTCPRCNGKKYELYCPKESEHPVYYKPKQQYPAYNHPFYPTNRGKPFFPTNRGK